MIEQIPLRFCPYCRRRHPEEVFHRLVKGRGGKKVVYQCDHCYKARQDLVASKERLEIMILNDKLSNKRAFQFSRVPKGREHENLQEVYGGEASD